MSNFSVNFKKLREQSKLSQKELGAALGLSRSAVGMYEQGKRIPDLETLERIADYFNISISELTKQNTNIESRPKDKGWIPVLGYAAAGIPIEAIENVLDWEQIDPHLLDSAEYFALEIKGDSMSPRIQEGDIVIVRVQPDIESGEIGIVQVNGDEATCKIVCKYRDQLTLKSINPAYGPLRYSINEMSDIPINILGKVVELRRKF